MLTKRRQQKYLSKEENEWRSQLRIFNETRNQEALHGFRIGIKKIQALVQLSKACSGKSAGKNRPAKKSPAKKSASKEVKWLTKMFRQAGTIRDANSTLRILQQHQLVSAEYKDQQARQMDAAATGLSELANQYGKKGKKAGRLFSAGIQAIDEDRIRNWYSAQLIRIGILLTWSGGFLHQARKKIKTLLYLHKMLPRELTEQLHLDTDYLDQLQEAIGQWHDSVAAAADFGDNAADLGDNGAGFGKNGAELGNHAASVKKILLRDAAEKERTVRALGNDCYRRLHLP